MSEPKGAHALAQEQCDALQQELNGLGAQMATARAGLVMQGRAYEQAQDNYANLEKQIVTRMTAVSERLSALQGLASQMPVDVPAPVPQQSNAGIEAGRALKELHDYDVSAGDLPAEVSQPEPEQT